MLTTTTVLLLQSFPCLHLYITSAPSTEVLFTIVSPSLPSLAHHIHLPLSPPSLPSLISAPSTEVLFGVAAFEGLQVIITPPVRALFCNAFSDKQQGAVTACISAIQTVAGLIGPALLQLLYSATVEQRPNLVFFVMAGINSLVFCFIWLLRVPGSGGGSSSSSSSMHEARNSEGRRVPSWSGTTVARDRAATMHSSENSRNAAVRRGSWVY
jgi:hypothetical protein